MSKYNEQYYIIEKPFGENSLYIKADQKTANRGYHYKKTPFGEAPFFFHNSYKDRDKQEQIRRQLTDIIVHGSGLLINNQVRDELKYLEVDGMQIYPSVYIDDDNEWHEDYWYLSFYEDLNCLDKENAEIDMDDFDDDDDDVEVSKFSLADDALDKIPEERRLLFKIGGVNMPYIFIHRKIADLFIQKGYTGFRFFTIADFYEGIQFRKSKIDKAIESAASKEANKVIKIQPEKETVEIEKENIPSLKSSENHPVTIEAMTKSEIEEFFDLLGEYVELYGSEFDLTKDVTLIEVEDLTIPQNILEALEQVSLLTAGNGIDAIRNDWLLNFAFKDKQDRYLNEERFFKVAVKVPYGDNKIADILKNYINYGGERLYSNAEDQTALIFTAWVLATHHPKYLELVLDFLKTLDWEHIFYERDEFLNDIKNTLGVSEAYIAFLIGLSTFHYENYFQDELDEEGALYDWIQDESNSQQAAMVFEKILNEQDDGEWGNDFFEALEEMLLDGKTYLKDFALAVAKVLDNEMDEDEYTTQVMDIFQDNSEMIDQLEKTAEKSESVDNYLTLAKTLSDEIERLLQKPSEPFIAEVREHLISLERYTQTTSDSRIAQLYAHGYRQLFSLPERFIYHPIELLKSDLNKFFIIWKNYSENTKITEDYIFSLKTFIRIVKRTDPAKKIGGMILEELERLDLIRNKYPELSIFQEMSDGPTDIHDIFRLTHQPFEFGDWIEDIKISPNGRIIGVVGNLSGFSSALLYEADGKPLTVLETNMGTQDRANRLAFSNDSGQVVVEYWDGLCLLETQKRAINPFF